MLGALLSKEQEKAMNAALASVMDLLKRGVEAQERAADAMERIADELAAIETNADAALSIGRQVVENTGKSANALASIERKP